jgi:REase_DpnII-MboI/Nucleotidyltransferase domain
MDESTYRLKNLAVQLRDRFAPIDALYLFGSRRYRTGSPRSDIDVLVELKPNSHVRSAELRAFSSEHCPALDLFLAEGGKAVSCENESSVRAASFAELVTKLEAVCFWKRSEGIVETADIDWDVTVPIAVDFIPTALVTGVPVSGRWPRSFRSFAREIESLDLPVQPYLGATAAEIADFLITELRRAMKARSELTPKGKGIQAELRSEYDFQNLFYLTVKPWLPGLGREDVTIRFDGQEKKADFNLFSSQMIWEMKHVKDANTKASVVKTLAGLSEFYRQHPNVRVAIFAILVEENVDLDDLKWEADFSHQRNQTLVLTRIFRNL